METPFRAVSFKKNEIITREKLDQVQSNYEWIKTNTPRGRFFKGGGQVRDSDIMIVVGRALIRSNAKSDSASRQINFGSWFAADCKPNITLGINADFQEEIFCTVRGPKGTATPTRSQFEINVNMAKETNGSKKDTIKRDFWVHWQAFGFGGK